MRAWTLLLTGLLVGSACSPEPPRPRADGSPRSRPAAEPAAEAGRPRLDADDLARRIHVATNEARRQRGITPLTWDSRLVEVARTHSHDMARRGYFEHVSPDGRDANDRARRADVQCRAQLTPQRVRVGVLENLYKTSRWTEWTERTVGGRTRREYTWQSSGAIVRAAVQGWLDSPGHRRNLLDGTARSQGVAVAFAADDSIYITQVLC